MIKQKYRILVDKNERKREYSDPRFEFSCFDKTDDKINENSKDLDQDFATSSGSHVKTEGPDGTDYEVSYDPRSFSSTYNKG